MMPCRKLRQLSGESFSPAESNSAPWREPGFANRDLWEDSSTRLSRSRVFARPRPNPDASCEPSLLRWSERELLGQPGFVQPVKEELVVFGILERDRPPRCPANRIVGQ